MRALVLLGLSLVWQAPAIAATKKPAAPKTVKPPPPPGPRPSPDARLVACALDGLPEAKLAYNALGHLWFLESEDVLFVGEVGDPLSMPDARAVCVGTHVRIEVVRGGTSMSAMTADFDFSEIVFVYGPQRTPEGKARRAARNALNDGDLEAARGALGVLARSDPEAAEMWVWIALEEIAAGHTTLAMAALAGLPADTAGRPTAFGRAVGMCTKAAREALRAGNATDGLAKLAPAEAALALDRTETGLSEVDLVEIQELSAELRIATGDFDGAATRLEAALAIDPTRTRSWLMLAETRWQNKDKAGSRDAYARVAAVTSPGLWPSELRERCPKCKN